MYIIDITTNLSIKNFLKKKLHFVSTECIFFVLKFSGIMQKHLMQCATDFVFWLNSLIFSFSWISDVTSIYVIHMSLKGIGIIVFKKFVCFFKILKKSIKNPILDILRLPLLSSKNWKKISYMDWNATRMVPFIISM